jgi:hypothetical protein
MNRRPTKRSPSSTQSAAQQAVLNRLRSGGTIQGAQPNNPLAYAAQFFDPRRFFDFSKPSSIPTLKGGMVNGREALIAPGGWNQGTAGLGEITVGGQRFFPAQSGKDLVYQRAPGLVGGQYGSIRVPDQLASSIGEVASTPADRAYQSAKAETAAMVATDPLMQQWSDAQKAKDFTTADQLGKQIWQNRYGKTEMGRPGGVIGSRNPLMDSTFGYQTGMSPGDIAKTITNPSAIPVSPGEAPYQIGDFGTRVGENGYDAASYGITPEMIEEIRKLQGVEEMKNRLLRQASTK